MRGGKVRKKGKKMSKGLVTETKTKNKNKIITNCTSLEEPQNKTNKEKNPIHVSGTRYCCTPQNQEIKGGTKGQ